jgi:hypothetical protein
LEVAEVEVEVEVKGQMILAKMMTMLCHLLNQLLAEMEVQIQVRVLMSKRDTPRMLCLNSSHSIETCLKINNLFLKEIVAPPANNKHIYTG